MAAPLVDSPELREFPVLLLPNEYMYGYGGIDTGIMGNAIKPSV